MPRNAELLLPKMVTVLREGYSFALLRADAVAAVTVAIVALPLSMAIAIASGVGPERGLYAAIIGGFLISLLGGSRFQIGGPAGAFIVLVATTVARHGIDGLLLVTAMSGAVMMLAGVLRIGSYVRLIPHAVVVGFTAAIAVVIFASQLHDLFGLHLAGSEPPAFMPKLRALWQAVGSFNLSAAAIALVTVAGIVALRRYAPRAPSLLIVVTGAAVLVVLLGVPIETIGSRFGNIPHTLPAPSLPDVSWQRLLTLLPLAMTFALLGAIESLLSAVVADGMTGRQHRSNSELIAQGVANIATACFGGLCVTGTIARTATNVRAGARTPVAGMLHAVMLLLFMMVAAPLVAYVPLAALAGVLVTVAWNMIDRPAIAAMSRNARADLLVLLVTLLLTLLHDLMLGIAAGTLLAYAMRLLRR
ncbi:MAG: SulP family inorganic anion transporter [Steroidobacteraceae bacterium]